jgi:hypothetical protein
LEAFLKEYNSPEDLPVFLRKYNCQIGDNCWLEHPLFLIMLPFTDHGEFLAEIESARIKLHSALLHQTSSATVDLNPSCN